MSNVPIAAPHTEGRIFGNDWSIANVAKLLRSNAGRSTWRHTATRVGNMAMVNQHYLRTVSAQHLPTSVSLIFMQLEHENCWYASLCFASGDDYLPWNGDVAETWLTALFGQDRSRVQEDGPGAFKHTEDKSVRQFTLAKQNIDPLREPPPKRQCPTS
jgi:hypothetical protein